MTPSRLAHYLTQETQSVTGLIDRMEKQGWVRRVRDLPDRRAIRLELTPEGESKLDETLAPGIAVTEELFTQLKPDEVMLVLLGPHMSAALVLAGVTCLMLFLGGLSWRYIGAALAVAVPLATLAAWVSPYRRERLLTFLDPERDPLGSGFQVVQSLIAVGSGGVLGRGLGHGAQKLYFLPYPHTDFIFSIVGEELGLVGALSVLSLFAVVAWKGAQAGVRAPDAFGRYLAWGLTGLLVMQALMHCSVAVSLIPSTGMPMPFLTYGGSAMVTALVASGLVLNVSQHG